MDNKDLHYNSVGEFADRIFEIQGNISVTVVGKYDSIRMLTEYLIQAGLGLAGVERFYDSWVSGYSDEYLLCICESNLFIEPVKVEGGYCGVYDDIVYILGDEVSAKLLGFIRGESVEIVYIDDADGECEKCDSKTCSCKTQREVDDKEYTFVYSDDASLKAFIALSKLINSNPEYRCLI